MIQVIVRIDFNSEEAIYVQLRNQIILGIANAEIKEGDNLPSVRELAETVGINMHTVNKAYTILKQEGYLKLDRRKGAVIALEVDKRKAMMDMMSVLQVILAEAYCKNITRDEIHDAVDRIYDDFLE